jgi:hypothetical protein
MKIHYPRVFWALLMLVGFAASANAEEMTVTETAETTATANATSVTATDAVQQEGFDLSEPLSTSNTLGAYFGYTNVGGESFVGFQLQPELQLGKLGIGLDIPLQFNVSTHKFRTDQYTDGVAWLRMIRFLSWGVKKQDKLYAKVGDLTGSYLGYGMLINNYSNSISVDKRKIGIDLDVMFNDFVGLEMLYSDIDVRSLNLLGLRPYVKPLAFTHIPIVQTLNIGFQYVTDHDKTGSLLSSDATTHNAFVGSAGMSGQALDMGITLLNIPMVRLEAYGSLAMLNKNKSHALGYAIDSIGGTDAAFAQTASGYKNGYGASAGLDLKVKMLANLVRLEARAERLWYSNYFTPHFFDISYEMDKDARILSNVTATQQKGTYADLGVVVLSKIKVTGGMMIPDHIGNSNPALLHLMMDGSELSPSILLQGEYIKGGLTHWNQAFTLDNRSLLSVRAAYRLAKLVFVGVDYNWTWAANANGKFVPTSYWKPYVGFKFNLGFLDKK